MNYLRLEVKIAFSTPFHTTGNRWRWGADKAVAVSPHGHYVLPATTLKGLLRSQAESLLRTWGIPVCMGPEVDTLCRDLENLCLVCQVFGHPRQAASLRFADAVPVDSTRALSQIRNGVAISRQRKASVPQQLFSIEAVEAPLTEWRSVWEGYFKETEEARKAAALICLAAHSIFTIGGGRSRGLGWTAKWEISVKLDGGTLTVEELREYWQVWAGGQKHE